MHDCGTLRDFTNCVCKTMAPIQSRGRPQTLIGTRILQQLNGIFMVERESGTHCAVTFQDREGQTLTVAAVNLTTQAHTVTFLFKPPRIAPCWRRVSSITSLTVRRNCAQCTKVQVDAFHRKEPMTTSVRSPIRALLICIKV